MTRYRYEGQIYDFEPGLTNDEVKERIANLPQQSTAPVTSARYASGIEEDEGFFQEVGEGVVSGLSRIPQGILELGTIAFDAAADTNYTEEVTKFFDETREDLGIDPTGLAGGISEGLAQFLVPGLGAASAVSRVSSIGKMARGLRSAKTGRKASSARLAAAERKYGSTSLSTSQKVNLTLQEAGAATAADFLVSTDGTQSIGDFFELGVTQTNEKKLGESGREAALRKLINKTKVGAESGLLTVGFPIALGATVKTGSAVGAFRPIEAINETTGLSLPGASFALAQTITGPTKAGIDLIKGAIIRGEERMLDPLQEVGAFAGMLNRTLGTLRYRGFLDAEVADQQSLVGAKVEGEVKRADGLLKNIEKNIDEYLKRPEVLEQSSITKQKMLNNFMDVLETGNRPDDLPEELFKEYMKARKVIDGLSERLLATGAVARLPEESTSRFMGRAEFIQTVRNNIQTGGYLRRRYRAFEDPENYSIPRGLADEREIFNMLRTGGAEGSEGDRIFKDIKERLNITNFRVTEEQTIDTLTDRQLRGYVDAILNDARNTGRGRIMGMSFRSSMRKLNPQLLNRRKVDLSTTRRILGEIRDPFEAYVATVSDLSTFIATDDFFTTFRRFVDDDIKNAKNREGRYSELRASRAEIQSLINARSENPAAQLGPAQSRYIDTEEYIKNIEQQVVANGGEFTDASKQKILEDLRDQGYYILGKTGLDGNIYDKGISESAFGAMHGIAIPEPMWRSMSNNILNDDNDFTKYFLRPVYGSFLKLKGMTQYAKTILSPVTQVRNVTSAALFAAAQGNFGNGANLGESLSLVLGDLFNMTNEKALEYMVELQQRGVIGSSAQLREIQDTLRKGLNPRTTSGAHILDEAAGRLPSDIAGPLEVARKKGWVRQMLGKAEDAYRGGDDVWKIYNYEFEHAKIKQAYLDDVQNATKGLTDPDVIKNAKEAVDSSYLKFTNSSPSTSLDTALKDLAADRVRNLVPNYELVPDAIKNLRRLPVGNFIAFPAEIIRTGFNTLDTAMRELSSDSKAIRQIGMRRLMGATTTFAIVPTALQGMAMKLTETSQEEIDAANRVAAPFQRNSIFIPVGRNEKGNLEVIDFSHTNPYDMLIKPLYAVMNSLDRDGRLSNDGVEAGTRAAWEAFSEFAAPFFEQSIAAAVIQDVMPKWAMGNGGETKTGAIVYKDVESLGKKLERSFFHVVNGLSPGISPFRIPTGADLSEVEAGRFIRGTLGNELGLSTKEPSTGREYGKAGEIIRALSGLNTQEFDPERILRFKANEFKSNRSEAATLFNDVVNREVSSREDYIKGYVEANEARLRAFREMSSYVDDLGTLGLTRARIRRQLKKEKLGNAEINSIMRGRYDPFTPSKDKMEEARRKRHDIPRSELRTLERQMRRLDISPDVPEPTPERLDFSSTPTAPSSNILSPEDMFLFSQQPEPQAAAPQAPVPGPTTKVPGQAVGTPVGFTYKGQQIPAELLGGNPEDIMKNVEIYRRSQQ